jgi:hypothetical protein
MRKSAFLLFVALPCLTAAAALAQPPAPDAGGRHRPDPAARHAEMCSDHLARESGRLAYLEAKLELTEAQKPLFGKWRQALLDSAAKHKAACLASPAGAGWGGSILDRQAEEEQTLSLKLQSLQASHSALKALYEGLTPAQRQVLDRPEHGHEGHQGPDEHRSWGHGPGGMGEQPPRLPLPQ